uniref:Uncharacterized protein n=1 Tax=Daphnia magna TaxID=35525 RepID=A0A0P6D1W7_9CRUS
MGLMLVFPFLVFLWVIFQLEPEHSHTRKSRTKINNKSQFEISNENNQPGTTLFKRPRFPSPVLPVRILF